MLPELVVATPSASADGGKRFELEEDLPVGQAEIQADERRTRNMGGKPAAGGSDFIQRRAMRASHSANALVF